MQSYRKKTIHSSFELIVLMLDENVHVYWISGSSNIELNV